MRLPRWTTPLCWLAVLLAFVVWTDMFHAVGLICMTVLFIAWMHADEAERRERAGRH